MIANLCRKIVNKVDNTQIKPKKEPVVHTDILGQEITEGCYVAVPHRNTMYICKVTKINPKMIRVVNVKNTGYRANDGWLVYPSEGVKLSGEEALAYIMKYA